MITIKDLKSVIDNNLLNDLYMQRDETVYTYSKEDKNNLKELHKKLKETRQGLESSIDNLPDCFQECKKQLKICAEEHIESAGNISAYFDEK